MKHHKYLREIERLAGVAIVSITHARGGHLRLMLPCGRFVITSNTPTHRRLNGPAFNLYLGDGRQVTVNVHNQKSIHGAIAFMKRLGRREAV